jgi:hypothetical protein
MVVRLLVLVVLLKFLNDFGQLLLIYPFQYVIYFMLFLQ